MKNQIINLLDSLKPLKNISTNVKHFDGLNTRIDEGEIIFATDKGKIFCLLTFIEKAYPLSGITKSEFTKIFVECPTQLSISLQSKKIILSSKRTNIFQSSNKKIKELIDSNQTIIKAFEIEPKLSVYTVNQIDSQSFTYNPKKFLIAKFKTIISQEKLLHLFSMFKELLVILSKFQR